MPHISKSQLEELMCCAKLYEYTRFKGLETKDNLHAMLGGTYHHTLEAFFREKLAKGTNRTPEQCADEFGTEFDKRIKEAKDAESLEPVTDEEIGAIKDKGIGLVKAYHPYAALIDPLAVEQQFELSIPGHDWTLYGYIDLVYKSYVVDGGGKPVLDVNGEKKWVPVVVDHKTTGSSPYDAKSPGRREEWLRVTQFSHEVAMYVLAYRVKFGGQEDRFEYHWAIKTKEPRIMVTPVKVGDTQLRWFMDLAVEQVERIKRGFFERNLTSWKHSPSCPAWRLCHGLVDEPEKKGTIKLV